jgi:ribulose-5-phosphate 4-epimerase/fuculose-1-phosphate aldolase
MADEPRFATVPEERLHRMRQCALGYRAFGALGWGSTGDGHISARDPHHVDWFWLLEWGVPFNQATIDDLVLVGPGGAVVKPGTIDGLDDATDADLRAMPTAEINTTAYNIHMPVHDARPEVVCLAHTHTAYGTPWSANAAPFRAISQEACSFVADQSLFLGEELTVQSYEVGTGIAEAMGATRVCIMRNHGLLLAGASVAETVGFFVLAERTAEVHVKAPDAPAISEEGFKQIAEVVEDASTGLAAFQYLVRSFVPDPSVVG